MRLDEVIPWGRSFDEYRRMFDLADADRSRRVLGCGDGPASFNAEGTALGWDIVSCDPIYEFAASEIGRRVEACYDTVLAHVRQHPDRFVWDLFPDSAALGQARLRAMRTFCSDFEQGKLEGRYAVASLPALPFAGDRFDLCLCSHLLFLYSEQLGDRFHEAAFRELLRVSPEVSSFSCWRSTVCSRPTSNRCKRCSGTQVWRSPCEPSRTNSNGAGTK